jgi:hypothetical protein
VKKILSLRALAAFSVHFGFDQGLDSARQAGSAPTGAGTEPTAGGAQLRLRASAQNVATAPAAGLTWRPRTAQVRA